MALEDLSQEDLIVIVVEALVDTRLGASVTHLLRLVHGDERVPARVKDDDVKAALAVVVEKGLMTYRTRQGLDNPTVIATQNGRDLVFHRRRTGRWRG